MKQLALLEDALPSPAEDLRAFDVIMVNASGGKDSMASLDYVAALAAEQGVLDRVVVSHADLGRMEWEGVPELARQHAASYGLRFEIARAGGEDLLGRVRRRFRMRPEVPSWPSAAMRWCTSDLKRGPLRTIVTRLVSEAHRGERVRVLNVMGMRREESSARAKLPEVAVDASASNGRREVTNWLPVIDWTEKDVWARIDAAPTRGLVHPAYAEGMPRLSCSFCVLASRSALIRAAQLRRPLALEYREVERETGWRFRQDLSMADIVDAADGGEKIEIAKWCG